MGVFLSTLWDRFAGTREYLVLMLGLDAAGKTTTLYKPTVSSVGDGRIIEFRYEACIHSPTYYPYIFTVRRKCYYHTVPTIGFNIEKVQFRNITFTVWDVGGHTGSAGTGATTTKERMG